MNLKSLLLSSDEKTVRVLRRVLSDLEIEVEHCSQPETAVRKITRQRFEAIIVDCAEAEAAGQVLRGAKAAPVNKRALSIALVESSAGLRGGFEMGAHFVLHKPLSVERARSSFRAVRALMKRERRQQVRVAVQVPVTCQGERTYSARTLDLCEGGMAIRFAGRVARESVLRFSLELPGLKQAFDVAGELAWEGGGDQAGVRFKYISEDQRNTLRQWLNSQLPDAEQDDPPVACDLAQLSLGGCYLKTSSPFPPGTRVVVSAKGGDANLRLTGVVRVAHPEFGMGVEFLQATPAAQEQVRQMIEGLHSRGDTSAEVQVEPDGLESALPAESPAAAAASDDALVCLFRSTSQVPLEVFLRQLPATRLGSVSAGPKP